MIFHPVAITSELIIFYYMNIKLTHTPCPLILIAFFMLFAGLSCERGSLSREIAGNIYLGTTETNGFWYLYLDDDTACGNGYIKRITNSFSAGQEVAVYLMNTADIPDGSYYLYAGIDFTGTNTIDPDDPSVWERIGWFGSSTNTPPSAPNVTLIGQCSITLYPSP